MEGRCNSSSSLSSMSSFGSVSALRATSTKSPPPPPPGLDLYGKRRQMVKLQVLDREIGLLQEELKSLDGLQPASRSCKELDTFIDAKQDPFIAKNQDSHKSRRFWKRIWGKCRFNLTWICCFNGCHLHLEMPDSCACSKFPGSRCLKKTYPCHPKCCRFPGLSCPSCSHCCCFKLYSCKCLKVSLCSNCCNPCCLSNGCTN